METPLCQVALSVTDYERSRAWYESLGLVTSGGMPPIRDELPARILELPKVDLDVHWLRGRDPMSQLEIMQFRTPTPRPLPEDFGLRHQGYGIVGLVVPELGRLRARFAAAGIPHVTTGTSGQQSLWIEDPDGIPLEILEKDPLGSREPAAGSGSLASIRSVTLTVVDLAKAVRFWTEGVGLARLRAGCTFNSFPPPLQGGVERWDEEVLHGGSLVLRLLAPRNVAVIPRLEDYRLSDVGVLNVAAIVDSAGRFADLVARVRARGYGFTTEEPMGMGDAAALYGHDDQRVSIEMGYVVPGHEEKYGWRR